MQLNKATIEQLKKSEGLRLEAYPDPGSVDGKPVTIGYGTTKIGGKPIKLGTKITKEQAERYLAIDMEAFADGVRKVVLVKLNDNQFGALVLFAYNIGLGSFKSSTLLKRLNQGDYASVPDQMRRWNKNDGKVMQGLINRREDEIALWSTPAGRTPVKSTEHVTGGSKTTVPSKGSQNIFVLLLEALIKLFTRR